MEYILTNFMLYVRGNFKNVSILHFYFGGGGGGGGVFGD
jgi:hypothetical protein